MQGKSMTLTNETPDTVNVLGHELSKAEFNAFVYAYKATQPIQIKGATMFMPTPESPKKLLTRYDMLRKYRLVESQLRDYRIGMRTIKQMFYWVSQEVRQQVSQDTNLVSLIKQHR